jgi:hypothetical protein
VQDCVEAAMTALVHDRWLVRRLPAMVAASGLRIERIASHDYLPLQGPDYMLTLVDRGADTLANARRIAPALADALKAEARRRVATGEFFGFVAFVGLTARKG